MGVDARRQAERAMTRRDARERTGRTGERAARRSRMPDLLGGYEMDDEDEDADMADLARMSRRTRRQYDERRAIDDVEGGDDVWSFHSSIFEILTLEFRRSHWIS